SPSSFSDESRLDLFPTTFLLFRGPSPFTLASSLDFFLSSLSRHCLLHRNALYKCPAASTSCSASKLSNSLRYCCRDGSWKARLYALKTDDVRLEPFGE